MRNRYVFIGDIHGCYQELQELLDKIEPTSDDLVISVGDFIAKGSDSERCLQTWMDTGYLAVKGNIDKAFCDWVDGKREVKEKVFLESFQTLKPRIDLVEYLQSLPLYLDIPEISVLVVHGGLLPDQRIVTGKLEPKRQEVIALRQIRADNGKWLSIPKNKTKPGDRFWSEIWDGDRTVIYGHTPQKSGTPKIDAKAIGIDTGCVFGGFLTTAVYTPDENKWDFHQIKALRQYAPWPKVI